MKSFREATLTYVRVDLNGEYWPSATEEGRYRKSHRLTEALFKVDRKITQKSFRVMAKCRAAFNCDLIYSAVEVVMCTLLQSFLCLCSLLQMLSTLPRTVLRIIFI